MNWWLIAMVAGTIWFVVLTTAMAICRLCTEADSRREFDRDLETLNMSLFFLRELLGNFLTTKWCEGVV